MSLLAVFKTEFYAWLCLFKGVSTAFLRPGLKGLVLMEASIGCHEAVISDLQRDFPHFEGDSFSWAKGHWPSFKRAINLLNHGKIFLDMKLQNQTLFIMKLNASKASYYTLPVVFPWGIHRALVMVWMTVQSSFLSCGPSFSGGAVVFCPQVPVLFCFVLFLLSICVGIGTAEGSL